jgi:hypothetical protein
LADFGKQAAGWLVNYCHRLILYLCDALNATSA